MGLDRAAETGTGKFPLCLLLLLGLPLCVFWVHLFSPVLFSLLRRAGFVRKDREMVTRRHGPVLAHVLSGMVRTADIPESGPSTD